MTAKEAFDAGRVTEAQKLLATTLRNNPSDKAARTFLFELLCFSGQYDRAEKQLSILAEGGGQAELGAVMYYSALHAERSRNELFSKQAFPEGQPASAPKGKLNGKEFTTLSDADPDIGPRLEAYAAGSYLWIPFEHIVAIDIEKPKHLRDTLWAPASVTTGPSFKGMELGEVLIPVVYPFTWKDSDESLWLGRSTAWYTDENGREFPVGQKILIVDGEEIPLLEIQTIEFASGDSIAQPA